MSVLSTCYWSMRRRLNESVTLREISDGLWLARRRLDRAVIAHAGALRGELLDIGCGVKPYRERFTQVTRYVGLDLPTQKRADVHGDACRLPFAPGSFDAVLCNQVLEHVPTPQHIFAEAARVLRPGGVLLLTTPMTWGLHLEPHDYFRYTPHGLRYLAGESGLHTQSVDATCGVIATATQHVVETFARRSRVIGCVLFPMLVMADLLDRAAGGTGDALDHVLLAVKPEQEACYALAA